MTRFSPRRCTLAGLLLTATLLLGGGLYAATVSTSSSTASQGAAATSSVQPVNAVIGNESYRVTFGRAPDTRTSEWLRLQTHLAYVEGLLRTADTRDLSKVQRERRAALLDQLHAYWKRGIFPKNTYQRGRMPVFIDEEGRLCAVGYLIAQSAGREVAERVNARFQLDRIEDMDAPVVKEWAERHGFALRELAMIQPMYCHMDPNHPCPGPNEPAPAEDENNMRKEVEIASMGLSASAALLNGYLIGTGRHSRVAAGAGLVTGGASLAIGLSGEAHFAAGDYALAGASLLVSGWQLLRSEAGERSGEDAEDDPTVVQNEASATPTLRPALVPTGTNDYAPGVHVRWRF